MGVDPTLTVLFCILGAVGFTMAGYAVHRTFGFEDPDEVKNQSDEQQEYMREVRRKNIAQISTNAQTRQFRQNG
jgi:hypothetical protein